MKQANRANFRSKQHFFLQKCTNRNATQSTLSHVEWSYISCNGKLHLFHLQNTKRRSINFVAKWQIISLVNQNSRGPTKHKSNHCLSSGNENVLLALAWPFSKTVKNALVWMGENESENDTKTLVWMQIFCSVFTRWKRCVFKNVY